MSELPQWVHDRFDELEFQIADMKRRQSNFIRPGTVKSYDPKTNTVIGDVGLETQAIPVFNHAGTGKNWHPMKVGQQITLLCPDGDLSNAVCLPGGFHDANPAPSQSADEDIVAERGTTRLRTTDAAAFLESGGASIKVEDGIITLTADKIVVDGDVHLGGEGGVPAAMQGTVDTMGHADIGNLATKVFVK